MIRFLYSLTFIFITQLSSQASADPQFKDYPATGSVQTCKPIDLDSYSRARNAKELIQKNNPTILTPNFAAKYVLIQIPYMMGTDWLIADCETGTFVKEIFTGVAEFKADSNLIKITEKNETQWKLWTGKTYIAAQETKTLPENPSIESRYGNVFSLYPSLNLLTSCAPLNYDSYFRAHDSKVHILNRKEDRSKPNFAGSYFLQRVDLLFETLWLIADCKTGTFLPEYLSGDLSFNSKSRLAVFTASGKAPGLFLWNETAWIKKPDPTLKESQPVENKIYLDQAKTLTALIPNPEHHSKIDFKSLQCIENRGKPTPQCSGVLDDPKLSEKTFLISDSKSKQLLEILKVFGRSTSAAVPTSPEETTWSIDEGSCISEKSTCTLRLK